MTQKKISYRIKCEKCGQFVYREEIINNYGRQTCRECLSIQMISKSYTLYLPTFILKQQGFKPLEKVEIINTPNGVLIRKTKKDKDVTNR